MEYDYIYSVWWVLEDDNEMRLREFDSFKDADKLATKLIEKGNVKALSIHKSICLNEKTKKFDEYLPDELDSEPLSEVLYVYKKCEIRKPKGYKE